MSDNAVLECSTIPLGDREFEHWWDASLISRMIAAFHLGRLINQFYWHLQQSLLLVSRKDKRMVRDVLGQLRATSCALEDPRSDQLKNIIGSLSVTCNDVLSCEAVADESRACFDDDESLSPDTPEERRRVFVESTAAELLNDLMGWIRANLSDSELLAFAFGHCLDQGPRRSDVYRFVARRVVRVVQLPGNQNRTESIRASMVWETRLFQPGELKPDTAWQLTLKTLLAKCGLLTQAIADLIRSVQPADQAERLRLFEQLDQIIRAHIGESDNDTAKLKVEFSVPPSIATPRSDNQAGSEPEKLQAPNDEVADPGQQSADRLSSTEGAEPVQACIPKEYLSRSMTKKEAANYHAGGGVTNATQYLKRLIPNEELTEPIGRGQRWRFDVRNFPEHVRSEMLTKTNKT